jgi:hypothetical protein
MLVFGEKLACGTFPHGVDMEVVYDKSNGNEILDP